MLCNCWTNKKKLVELVCSKDRQRWNHSRKSASSVSHSLNIYHQTAAHQVLTCPGILWYFCISRTMKI